MSRKIIRTDVAPEAIGPYSQGVVVGGTLYTAGQIGLDPATGDFAAADAAGQAHRALENCRAIVEAAGFVLTDVARVTLFFTDMADFAAVNDIYAGFFPAEPPARAAAEVSALPKGALIMVDMVAVGS